MVSNNLALIAADIPELLTFAFDEKGLYSTHSYICDDKYTYHNFKALKTYACGHYLLH